MFEGRKIGTHAAWHVLNALVLFLLMRASLEGGPRSELAETETIPIADWPAEPREETPVVIVPETELPAPKPLAERVASTNTETADEAETPDEKAERKRVIART